MLHEQNNTTYTYSKREILLIIGYAFPLPPSKNYTLSRKKERKKKVHTLLILISIP